MKVHEASSGLLEEKSFGSEKMKRRYGMYASRAKVTVNPSKRTTRESLLLGDRFNLDLPATGLFLDG